MKHYKLMIVVLLILLVTPGYILQVKASPTHESLMTSGSANVHMLTCPGFLPSRLTAGGQGRVTPGLPNSLRNTAGGWRIGSIPAGAIFNVIAGPTCVYGVPWWNVNYNGLTGWTAEGYRSTYWLEPYVWGSCSMGLPPRLTVGSWGRVTPGLPNTLRASPSGATIGQIPGGATFTILQGPQCSQGIAWWQISYQSMVGWTGEGSGSTYWLEPVKICSSTLPQRLSVGGWGRVTPGLPNSLRTGPSSASLAVGQIPGGAAFSVIGGPECSGGMTWWQVNYQGLVGWTPEGKGYVYWTEPF